jgi:hypothetical protein
MLYHDLIISSVLRVERTLAPEWQGYAYKTKNAAFVSHDIQVGDRA